MLIAPKINLTTGSICTTTMKPPFITTAVQLDILISHEIFLRVERTLEPPVAGVHPVLVPLEALGVGRREAALVALEGLRVARGNGAVAVHRPPVAVQLGVPRERHVALVTGMSHLQVNGQFESQALYGQLLNVHHTTDRIVNDQLVHFFRLVNVFLS